MSEEGEKNLQDNELESVAGGIDKEHKRTNNECPKCYEKIRLGADAMIEGRDVRKTYACDSCQLRWLARNFYNNAVVQHELVSYEPVNGAHQVLGNYRDLRNNGLI